MPRVHGHFYQEQMANYFKIQCPNCSGISNRLLEIWETTKQYSTTILKYTLPVGVKLVTAGMIDIDSVSDKALSDFAGKIAQDRIDRYENDKQTIAKFKESLSSFVEELGRTGDKKLPLVFFIDELDRCRPTYAVELLERIKHLFNISSIIFVLATDKEQLGHSIRALYGQQMNVDGYLRRFIDLEYQLPMVPSETYCEHLFRQFGIDELLKDRDERDKEAGKQNLLETFSGLASAFGFSLRVQEQCLMRISLALRATPKHYRLYSQFLATLIAIKVALPEQYQQFMNRTISAEQFWETILKNTAANDFLTQGKYHGRIIEACIMAAHCSTEREFEALQAHYESIVDAGPEKSPAVLRARIILDYLHRYLQYDYDSLLKLLASRIEITNQFSV